MSLSGFPLRVLIGIALWGFLSASCQPVAIPTVPPPAPASGSSVSGGNQTPSTSNSSPSPPPAGSRPNASAAQKRQYVWERMMDGVGMGVAVAGPYGAGAGLVVGMLYGVFTADSHHAQLNAKIGAEEAKNKELEAQIEQELERQRDLESQLGGDPQAGSPERSPNAAPLTTEKKNPAIEVASLPAPVRPGGQGVSPLKNVEVKDVNGDGLPDLWIYYDPLKPGEVVRQEEDANRDGVVDTWSYFSAGNLVRREVDASGDGRADRVFTYEGENLAREERNEGDGKITYRAVYANGRLARVEKDLDRDGRVDLWLTYDAAQAEPVVLKEERDLDRDGAIDLWSYYKEGRLVQRDVSAAGLEVIAREEGMPMPPAPQVIARPTKE